MTLPQALRSEPPMSYYTPHPQVHTACDSLQPLATMVQDSASYWVLLRVPRWEESRKAAQGAKGTSTWNRKHQYRATLSAQTYTVQHCLLKLSPSRTQGHQGCFMLPLKAAGVPRRPSPGHRKLPSAGDSYTVQSTVSAVTGEFHPDL